MKINLLAPKLRGEMSLEETINLRKSIRQYKDEP
ncbi:nitroreductase, partial [Thermococci archaeon]